MVSQSISRQSSKDSFMSEMLVFLRQNVTVVTLRSKKLTGHHERVLQMGRDRL
jgi:hypothetical protein